MKSGNLNLLEPSGPLQACDGTALLLAVYIQYIYIPILTLWYFMLLVPHIFLQLIYKPTSKLNKVQFMTHINLLHTTALPEDGAPLPKRVGD